jgi:serine/threonine protein kinase
MCGTYHWMAPEVMLAPPPVESRDQLGSPAAAAPPLYGPPADVYSFAVVCWELATQQVQQAF